jgi:hypothetical protein
MAIVDIERTWEFWKSGLSGEAFEIYNPPGEYEEVKGEKYNIGEIVRHYQHAWAGKAPNHFTPIDMLDLLFWLDEFTTVLEEQDLKRRMPLVGPQTPVSCEDMEITAEGYGSICRDLRRWRLRLDEYMQFTAAVPVEQQSDRSVILWEVTAPLFVGWYGGPTGTEIPLDPDAFPPGFDPLVRHPADIASPYMIANGLGIWVAWQDERRKRLVADLTDPFKPSGTDWALIAAAGALVLGGYALLHSD